MTTRCFMPRTFGRARCGRLALTLRAVIELLGDMPDGTLGFRATGAITSADYAGVVLPAIEAALAGGGTLRSLYQIEREIEVFDPRVLWGQIKGVNTIDMQDLGRFERTAVATDETWIRTAAGRFGWMLPGDFRLFGLGEAQDARAWLAA